MQRQFFTSILILLTLSVYGQSSVVTYDRQMAVFNGNQPLPAETPFIVKGNLAPNTKMVRLSIVGEGSLFGESDFVSTWVRPENNNVPEFSLRVNYPLRGGKNYDFLIAFYKKASDEEIGNLRHALYTNLASYLELSTEVKKDRVVFAKPGRAMVGDLNEIIYKGVSQYASLNTDKFDGFSDLVVGHIEKMNGLQIEQESGKDLNSGLNKLLEVMIGETENYIRSNLVVVEEQQIVSDYPVEKTRTDLDLVAGYAGVWFDGNEEALDYGSAPFVGVSVPFGNKVFAGDFWSNLSADFGVMLTNMENADGEVISGPVVKRPVLVGLSYKMFKFVRINAGMAVVETRSEGDSFIEVDNIMARPYVGVSAGISLWMDFRD